MQTVTDQAILYRYTKYHPDGRVEELPVCTKLSPREKTELIGGRPERVPHIYWRQNRWIGSAVWMAENARYENCEPNMFFNNPVPGWGVAGIALREERAKTWMY